MNRKATKKVGCVQHDCAECRRRERDRLTPAMEAFVGRMVKDGRAPSRAEFMRYLVAQEIREWENAHSRAFNQRLDA